MDEPVDVESWNQSNSSSYDVGLLGLAQLISDIYQTLEARN